MGKSKRREKSPASDHGRSKKKKKASPTDEADERLLRLELMVEQLVRTNTSASSSNRGESGSAAVRYIYKSDCVPEFNPGDVNMSAEQWIRKIDQLADVNAWDEKTIIYQMQSRLAGLAKEWFNSLNCYDLTWDEWKSLILKSFPYTHDFASSLRKLVNRVKSPSESMTEYYFAKMNFLRACKITGKDAVSCLIDGLGGATLKNNARAGRYNTPEELYSEYLSSVVEEKLERRDCGVRGEEPSKSERNFRKDKSVMSCFNCGQRGHISTKCFKPRVECKKCNRLGHTTEKCLRSAKQSLNVSANKKTSECYFTDCIVNGIALKGYIDTGCCAVTIRETDAKRLKLQVEPCNLTVNGFGGGVSKVVGKTKANLEVDLASANVEMLVVPDRVQNVSVLIGQPFVNADDVTMVMRKNEVRLVGGEIILPEVDVLVPKKVSLWAKGTTVIPPNYAGFVEVYNKDNLTDDIYIELQQRPLPNSEYWIPRCVVNAENGAALILNVSKSPLKFNEGQLLLRGEKIEAELDSQLSCNVVSTKNLTPFTLSDVTERIDKNLSIEQQRQLLDLINKYRDCFATNIKELGKTSSEGMTISLRENKTISYKPYRMSFHERSKLREIVDELVENDLVRESTSPFSSPVLLVKKKNGESRMCIDFRSLNAITLKDQYPMPRIDDQLDRLKGSRYFSSLDLASGYYQIPLEKESIPKTAFITPDGHYEFLRMPFGLVNAPAVFQRTINKVLGPLRFTSAMAYMDDVLVLSKTYEEGLDRLEDILRVFQTAGLTLRLEKCNFLKQQLEYLGYDISVDTIQPGKRKINSVIEFPKPANVHQMRQFLGLASYFRRFIRNFALKAKPLTSLLKNNTPFIWTEVQQTAFDTLKDHLSNRPVLALYDHNAKTELHTDASKLGIGGMLLQNQDDGLLKPVAYFSRTTTPDEQRYHSYELETLAVICSLKRFRVYLLGLNFKVITDCNALRSAFKKKDLVPRIGRWWLSTQEFDFTVEYRAGNKMTHVDALSRNAITDTNEDDNLEQMIVNITSDDWVLACQLKDDRCRYLLEVLAKNPVSKDDVRIHDEYLLHNGRLYRKVNNGRRWVVPKTSRRDVVMAYHDHAGHLAEAKTLDMVQRKYWFPSMRKYIKRYIACCLGCMYNKVPAGKQSGELHSIDKGNKPFDTLHVDHLGPFVKSTKRNTHLLLIIDGFTKFAFLIPVQNTKVEPVIKAFDGIFDTFGVPRRIICDRGSCFTSKKFTEYCVEKTIKRILNATATPRANGQAERYNRTILTSIASSTDCESKWDQSLKQIQMGINASINATTKKSPYELLLGYVPRNFEDKFLTAEVCEDDYDSQIHITREKASEEIRRNQSKQKLLYDKKRAKSKTFKTGQLVLVRKPKGYNDGTSRKLMPRYSGPYEIIKVLKNDRYVIKDLPGSKRSNKPYTGVFASDKMKHYAVHDSTDSENDN